MGIVNNFAVGFGAGYVLGTKAGRERYEQLQRVWRSLARQAQSVRKPESIRQVMTPNPETVTMKNTLAEAAAKMKRRDAGAMVVVDESRQVVGILTDRDITIRAVAEGRDPKTATVDGIASTGLQMLSPNDPVEHAVTLMRDHNLRRVPVVENGRPVGIVSIGDLAEERDPRSALADISRAPANR
jgi:CBS domain-containing protein